MDTFDDINEPVIQSPVGRKKTRQSNSYKRNQAKKARHSAAGKAPVIQCAHNVPGVCVASLLSESDLGYLHGCLYSTTEKVRQDAILLSYMEVQNVKRRRQKVQDESNRKSRDLTVKYYVMTEEKQRMPVCKASFMGIFSVKKDRISSIAKHWFDHGVSMPEKRGGARNIEENERKRKFITDHIETFHCRASHYARRGAPGRKYLPCDLSVKKIHAMFQAQNHEQISYSFYYSVFMHNFNLGFGHPSKDICSTCAKFRMAIKDPELSEEEKKVQSATYILHRRRGRKFYDILNSVGETFTVCFDMMENLVLPKSAIGQAFYSRQLYMYVFGVVRHRGQCKTQGMEDVNLFVWLEHQNRKDSNMVASALYYYFCTLARQELQEYQTLRLFSDSCYGQNKNISVVSMLCALRKQWYRNLHIEYNFPIRGHSFLPADRVFGRIEQSIRKKDTILLPSEYIEILQKHGNVHEYGRHWQCLDFKAAAVDHCRSKRSFKISEARVLEISSEKIGIKSTYSAEFCYHSVLKRGKKWESFIPVEAPFINCVQDTKKTDVLKLINEIGVNAQVRKFYQEAFANVEVASTGNQDLEESSDEDTL